MFGSTGLRPSLPHCVGPHYVSGADLIFSLALWVPDCGSFLCLHASDLEIVPWEAECLIMLVEALVQATFGTQNIVMNKIAFQTISVSLSGSNYS